jgi:hypothetical protein
MTTKRKWACWLSLSVAGLLSSLFSFLGLFGLAWGGFLRSGHPAWMMAVFFPFALALPLFVLASAVSRLAMYALWAAVPFPWLGVIATSFHDFKPGLIGFLEGVVPCAYLSVALALLAALVQYGTHFYQITHDSQWIRWRVANHESAN